MAYPPQGMGRVSIRPYDVDVEYTYFVDRMTWVTLPSDYEKLEILKRFYHGRGGLKASWWDDEEGKPENEWTPPPTVVGVNPRENQPWKNAIHLRNSKDGIHISQIYITPKIIASSKLAMRLDMRCPLLTDLPTGAVDIVIGFEVPFQGGLTLCALYIEKNAVVLIGRLMKPDGTFQVISTDITSWFNTGGWHELRFIWYPPTFRVVDGSDPTTKYGQITFTDVTFFPKVIPFFANECSNTIVSGIYIGEYAVWRLD
jgi:hypothetical protein